MLAASSFLMNGGFEEEMIYQLDYQGKPSIIDQWNINTQS